MKCETCRGPLVKPKPGNGFKAEPYHAREEDAERCQRLKSRQRDRWENPAHHHAKAEGSMTLGDFMSEE